MQLKNTLEGSTLVFDQDIPVLYFNKSQRPLRIRFYQFFKGSSVISTAMDKAHATYNLQQWFVPEKVKEEDSEGGIISKLKMVKDDGYGRLMIDNELGNRSAPESIV